MPFNEGIELGQRLSGKDAVRSARVAALYANVLNGLATEMELPFGVWLNFCLQRFGSCSAAMVRIASVLACC